MKFERPVDYRAGDEEKQRIAEARAKAIREGKLPEFMKEKGSGVATVEGKTGTKSSIAERKEKILTGEPWAPWLQEATRIKLMKGDKRSPKEIAQELMEKAEGEKEGVM